MLPSPTQTHTVALRALTGQVAATWPVNQYSLTRLARIADQAEYFVENWPAEYWPLQTSKGVDIPPLKQLLEELAAIKHLCIPCHLASTAHSQHEHQAFIRLQRALEYFR
jgi:hypothetical protein